MAQLQLGAEPDRFLGGRSCSDHTAAHHLVRVSLIDGATLGLVGRRSTAFLTPAMRQALDACALAA